MQHKGSSSVGLDLSSQFPSLSNHLGLFPRTFPSTTGAVCAGVSLVLESQGKPTSGGSPNCCSLGKILLRIKPADTLSPLHLPAVLLTPPSQVLLLAGEPRFSTRAGNDFPIFLQHGAEPLDGHAPSVSMLWPAASPRLPSQSMVCFTAYLLRVSKQGFQFHHCASWSEDSPNKGLQVPVHHLQPVLLSTTLEYLSYKDRSYWAGAPLL